MTIGNRVRREREKRGWSIRELARRAAVSPGAVSKLEGGSRVSPSLELGKRLAKALGVTLDYLAGMYDEEEADVAAPRVVRKNAVASPPSQDENHRAASRHDGARPKPCCALKGESSTGQAPIGEAGTAPAPGVSQR